jgi:hypothetical protein
MLSKILKLFQNHCLIILPNNILNRKISGCYKRLGAPEVLIYGTGKEIVAGDRGAYPKKLGKWRGSLNRTVVGSFGIQAEVIFGLTG